MKTCPNCKNPIEDDVESCPRCGFRLGSGEGAAPNFSSERSGPGPDELSKVHRQASSGVRHLVLSESNQEVPFEFGKGELLIGRRDPESGIYPEVDLTGHGGELEGVSRRHARLHMQGEQVFIEDLNSTNFTFLNRQRLQPGQLYHVHDGDEIRLGSMVLVYHAY